MRLGAHTHRVLSLFMGILFSYPGPVSAIDKWVPAPLMQSRSGAAISTLQDGRILAAGGGFSGYLDSAEIFDPSDSSWNAIAPLSHPRGEAVAARLLDGRIIVVGGRVPAMGAPLTVGIVEIYDPIADSWTEIASLNYPRERHTVNILSDGSVFVAGGGLNGVDEALDSTEVLSSTDGSWLMGPSLMHARKDHTATALPDGRILFLGGRYVFGQEVAIGEILSANGVSLSEITPTPHPMSGGSAIFSASTGEVYRLGGFASPNGAVSSIDAYLPSLNTWRTAGALIRSAVYGSCTAVLSNGLFLVSGGNDGHRQDSSEVFDPDTGRGWLVQGRMSVPRDGHACISLPNGNVIAIEGNESDDPDSSYGADIFIGDGSGIFYDYFDGSD